MSAIGTRGGGAAVPVLVMKVGVPSTDESHGAQFRGDSADLPRSTPPSLTCMEEHLVNRIS